MRPRHLLLVGLATTAAQEPPSPPTPPEPPLLPPTRFAFSHSSEDSTVLTTCTSYSNAPCAIRRVQELLGATHEALKSSAHSHHQTKQQLQHVSNGKFNADFNFWLSVFNESGYYVACGRKSTSLMSAGTELIGQHLEDNARDESGIEQRGLWDRVKQAAAQDGYFKHIALDGWAGHDRTFSPSASDAIERVGFVRVLDTAGLGRLYITSSYTDAPMPVDSPQCKWTFDGICSSSFARRVVGVTMSKLLGSESEGEFQQVLHRISVREYNENQEGSDSGFYPFVFDFDGNSVAHGANPALIGHTLQDIISDSPLDGLVDGEDLHEAFVGAAEKGGGWVAYWWRNAVHEEPYVKLALLVGVWIFGRHYYVGAGFNHVMSPLLTGPHCAECMQDFNYPCAWANTLALAGHTQSLLFMSNWYTAEHAFERITAEPEYGGGGAANRSSSTSSDWLYAFVIDFNGTMVAHGAEANHVGRNLSDIVASVPSLAELTDGWDLHLRFREMAESGGGWVAYTWKNSETEPAFDKMSYVTAIVHDERKYYLGVGMGDRDWTDDAEEMSDVGGGTSRWTWGCSVDRKHPCSEDWAHAVMGQRIASVLKATSPEELYVAFVEASVGSAFGFDVHVHNSTHVLYDFHDKTFMGSGLDKWLRTVGLSRTDIESFEETGSWLGPFEMRLTTGGPTAQRYLFVASVVIRDEVLSGVDDGVSSTYTFIVPVSAGEPMLTAAPPQLEGTDYYCLERLSVDLEDAGTSDRIKCVTNWDAIAARDRSDECADSGSAYESVCTNFDNTWGSASDYSTGLECIQPQTAGNDTDVPNEALFCGCKEGYVARFASRRVLGSAVQKLFNVSSSSDDEDEVSMPPDAQCAARKHRCTGGSNSCTRRLQLQMVYEQYCQLAEEPWRLSTKAVAYSVLVFAGILFVVAICFEERRRQTKKRQLRYAKGWTTASAPPLWSAPACPPMCSSAPVSSTPAAGPDPLSAGSVGGAAAMAGHAIQDAGRASVAAAGSALTSVSSKVQSSSIEFVQTLAGGYVEVIPVVEAEFSGLPGLKPSRCFHLFLSHAWPLGQSVCQLIKQRASEMLPSARVFLDVDDLLTGSGTAEVDHTKEILVFAIPVYFEKFNCVKELFRALVRKKPITLLLPDAEIHGVFTQEMIREIVTDEWVARWKLHQKAREWAKEWGVDSIWVPSAAEICDALFAQPPLEWSRIPAFQNQTMKLICRRLLPASKQGLDLTLRSDPTFRVPRSILAKPIQVFCSPHNLGATELAEEVARRWPGLLIVTKALEASDHVLLYLNANTWGGEGSKGLAADVSRAQRMGVHLQLCHEFPSLLDLGSARAAHEFSKIMELTPHQLTQGATNIYKKIAVALKCNEWRSVGLIRTAQALSHRHPRVPIVDERTSKRNDALRGKSIAKGLGWGESTVFSSRSSRRKARDLVDRKDDEVLQSV
jgi:hypothetical protein